VLAVILTSLALNVYGIGCAFQSPASVCQSRLNHKDAGHAPRPVFATLRLQESLLHNRDCAGAAVYRAAVFCAANLVRARICQAGIGSEDVATGAAFGSAAGTPHAWLLRVGAREYWDYARAHEWVNRITDQCAGVA